MVSTPFGLKIGIVFLCYESVGAITKRPIKKGTNQSGPQHDKNTYSATQRPQYQEIHNLLGLKQSKVFCFLYSFSFFFAIIRLFKNTFQV